MITYGSTFSGIGGLDLAVERVFEGARPIWHVEPDPYAAAVLRRHWPDVPNLDRVELIDATTPRPDIICGGFPCQDISTAGKGAGLAGKRSGLWWELAHAVRILRPRVVILENVAALLTRGLVDVLGELASLGFDAEWSTLRASDVGAPHRRNRVFIVALDRQWRGVPNTDGQGREPRRDRARAPHSEADRRGGGMADPNGFAVRQEREREGPRGAQAGVARGAGRGMANPVRDGRVQGSREEHRAGRSDPEVGDAVVDADATRWEGQRLAATGPAGRGELADPGGAPMGHPDERGLGDHGQPGLRHDGPLRGHDPYGLDGATPWPPAPGDQGAWARWSGPQPGVRRDAYGPPRGLDARRRRASIKCLGNAVVPQQAEAAIRELWGRLNG